MRSLLVNILAQSSKMGSTVLVILALTSMLVAGQTAEGSNDEPGVVTKCYAVQVKGQQTCLVKTPNLKVGSKVQIYTTRGYWVATGEVQRVRGDFGLAVFTNASTLIVKDLIVKTPSRRDDSGYSFAFATPSDSRNR